MSFIDQLNILQEDVKQLQSSKEIVYEEDVIRAFVILNYIKYNNVADVFLGCSALNLLNTYVKQSDSKIDYTFRLHLQTLLKGIEDINRDNILSVYFDDSKRMIMFVFGNFQFSFHGEKHSDLVKRLENGQLVWDGIRKQMCSVTIFDFASSNNYISNKTTSNNILSTLVDEELDSYNSGFYRFIKGKLVKVRDVNRRPHKILNYDKNYVRLLLFQCTDRPVILTGIFKKIWDKHVTFTTVRPYIKGCQTETICNHINLYRPHVEQCFDMSKFVKDKRYFIIGYCKKYPRCDRMGVQLALDYKPSPLFRVHDFYDMPQNIFEDCHRFEIDNFISSKQRHLKL